MISPGSTGTRWAELRKLGLVTPDERWLAAIWPVVRGPLPAAPE